MDLERDSDLSPGDEGFSGNARQELRELGLLSQQIEEIEFVALPTMRALLRRAPAKNAVIAELRGLDKALRDAHLAIGGLLASTSTSGEVLPKYAALARVIVASFDAGAEGDVLDQTLSSIGAALFVVEGASASMGALPATRQRTASPVLIGLIDKALFTGFAKAHGCWPRTGQISSREPLPPYPIVRSYAEGSNYMRIVELSFEAAGAGPGSRERPIREFMSMRKARRG